MKTARMQLVVVILFAVSIQLILSANLPRRGSTGANPEQEAVVNPGGPNKPVPQPANGPVPSGGNPHQRQPPPHHPSGANGGGAGQHHNPSA